MTLRHYIRQYFPLSAKMRYSIQKIACMKTLSFHIPDGCMTRSPKRRRGGANPPSTRHCSGWRATAPCARDDLRRNQRISRRHAFERHFGEWKTGNPNVGDNRADDADLARYRAGGSDSLMLHRSALSCCVLVPIKPIQPATLSVSGHASRDVSVALTTDHHFAQEGFTRALP